jgi:parallel beta-helix repeat protein
MKSTKLMIITALPLALLAAGYMASTSESQVTPISIKDLRDPRTRISSLPFTIDECGSYFLTGCLTGVSGFDGITIEADDVTLDLNGFTLIGVPGSLSGVCVPNPVTDLLIKEGTIQGWPLRGIDAQNAQNSSYSDIKLLGNGSDVGNAAGLLTGIGCTVTNCVARDNVGHGLIAGSGSVMTTCVGVDNRGHGMSVDESGTIIDCTALDNDMIGIVGGNATLSGCSSAGNLQDGILVFSGSIVGCTAIDNGAMGIRIHSGTIMNCHSEANQDSGFDLSESSTITGCTATENIQHGISLNQNCLVRANMCQSNDADGDATGAGIYAISSGNRIEGNSVISNAHGIQIPDIPNAINNLVIKNSARANQESGTPSANFDIRLLNSYGPIINVAQMGNMSSVTGSDHPWANFEY